MAKEDGKFRGIGVCRWMNCNYKIPLLELERLFKSQCEGGNCGWERKNLCGVVLGVKGTKVNARGKGRRKI